jgi:hypothetical protein
MSASSRLVGRFALVFALAFAVLAAAWIFAAPRYGAAISAAAQPALHWIESSDVTVLSAQDDAVWAYRRVGDNRIAPFMFFDRYAFFAIIPLLALFAATPGLRIRQRAVRALVGASLLFLVHVSYVVASIELSYAAAGLTAGGPHTIAQWVVRLLWEAAPIAIWLAFTAGAWVRSLRAVRAGNVGCVRRAERSAGTGRIIAWTPREGRTE